jgi:hypothetical protein
MSRARNIKPGFFKNDRLAECDPLARLLFAGLWCEADREGRLEDRPKRIKIECLPYDECDANALLAQLEHAGFIARYTVNEFQYIQILEFKKHQNPHVREPASIIPALDEHCASTTQAPDKHRTGPADSPFLIPDSREKTIPPDGGIVETRVASSDPAAPTDADNEATDAASPRCPVAEIIALYHAALPELPRVVKLTTARSAAIRQRWREDLQTLDDWRAYFADVKGSQFLMGRTSPREGRMPFRATLPWLVKAENFAKVSEGKYHGNGR